MVEKLYLTVLCAGGRRSEERDRSAKYLDKTGQLARGAGPTCSGR